MPHMTAALQLLDQGFLTGFPVKYLEVPRKNDRVFSFDPQMHKQQ